MEKAIESPHTSIIDVQPIPVFYQVSKEGVISVIDTQKDIEAKVETLKGRKCFGVYYPETGEYRAAVSILKEETPEKTGLQTWEIPGGRYGRMKLVNWVALPNLGEAIGKAVEMLKERYQHDPSRPSVEYYRNERELHIWLPIK